MKIQTLALIALTAFAAQAYADTPVDRVGYLSYNGRCPNFGIALHDQPDEDMPSGTCLIYTTLENDKTKTEDQMRAFYAALMGKKVAVKGMLDNSGKTLIHADTLAESKVDISTLNGHFMLEHQIGLPGQSDSQEKCEDGGGQWDKGNQMCFGNASDDVYVSQNSKGELQLDVDTMSTNYHMCDFSSPAYKSAANMITANQTVDVYQEDGSTKKMNCQVSAVFSDDDNVTVMINDSQACSQFCGASVSLEIPKATRTLHPFQPIGE